MSGEQKVPQRQQEEKKLEEQCVGKGNMGGMGPQDVVIMVVRNDFPGQTKDMPIDRNGVVMSFGVVMLSWLKAWGGRPWVLWE